MMIPGQAAVLAACVLGAAWGPGGFAAASSERAGDQAAALLTAARTRLDDAGAEDAPAIRTLLEEVRALPVLPPGRQAEVCLGLAEACLLESDYAGALAACAAAESADSDPAALARAQRMRALARLQQRDYGRAHTELGRLLEMEGLDALDGGGPRQAREEIEALHEVLEFLPLLRADRPRLFFTAETWPAVRERALTTDKARFDALAAQTDAIPVTTIPPDVAHPMMEAAFVCRVTGSPVVCEKVRHMLRAALDGTSYSAYPRVCWAAAYDWLWNDLPPSERLDLARAMTRSAWQHYGGLRRTGRLTTWPHYYSASALYYLGLALLSDDLDDVTHVRALSVLAAGLKMHRDRIAALLEIAGDDGAWQTNVEYDFSTVPGPMVLFLLAWTPAAGLPLPAEWAYAAVNPELILRMTPGFERDVFLHLNYAGHSGGAWGYGNTYSGNLYEWLEAYRHLFGQFLPEQAAIAHALCRRMSDFENSPLVNPTVFNRSGQAYPPLRFLLTDLEKAPAPGLPAGLPIARYYEGNGLALMSSGFGPADTYALFSAGEGGGPPPRRHDFDAGHFSIYRTGMLALDTGVRNALGHSANYRHQTVAHNAVLIRMEGESFTSVSGPVTSNAGGQNKYPHEANTLAFASRPLYAYVAADLAPVYHPDKCAWMTRQFVFVPPAHFVVFDRAVSRQADQPKTWLLHTASEPALDGLTFRADQGSGRLFCRTLLPKDAVIEAIGGPGREFWADGRNWPIEDAYRAPDNSARTQPTGTADWWTRYGHNGHDGRRHTAPVEAMGRWRIEVKPGAARTEDLFLHLIEVGDPAALAAMSPATLVEEHGAVGVEFQAGPRTVRVVFRAVGEVGGQIRLAEHGALLAEESLAAAVQPQEGLARVE